MKKEDLVVQLRAHLEYLREIGVEYVAFEDKKVDKVKAKGEALEELWRNYVSGCTRCRLYEGRTNIVFGEGNPNADLMFIGEGPGRDEDIQGLPFVGRAGQKLNEMILAMGLRRGDVYIGNVVKCRPPENRAPRPDEMRTCMPFLEHQIAIIQPKTICSLGTVATQALLNTGEPISKLRNKFSDYKGIKVMPTYHPAYLLRNYTVKTRSEMWDDLKKVVTFISASKE